MIPYLLRQPCGTLGLSIRSLAPQRDDPQLEELNWLRVRDTTQTWRVKRRKESMVKLDDHIDKGVEESDSKTNEAELRGYDLYK